MDTLDTQGSAFKLDKKGSRGGKVNSSTRIKKEPNELKSYHETCLKCGLQVSSRAMFCGNCGYVQIKNDLIHESSTSIYDPGDRSVKPWREKSIVAKNNWKSRVKNVKVEKRDPWRPTMKSTRVYKKMVIGVPTLLQNGTTDKTLVEMTAHERMKQYDSGRKIEVRYKGRIWRRAGEQHRRKKGLLQLPNQWNFDGASSEATFVREVPDEEVFPLAVFEVDWMQVSVGTDNKEEQDTQHDDYEAPTVRPKTVMTIHISLYQHVAESEEFDVETNKVQRWLRVGYLVEGETNSLNTPHRKKMESDSFTEDSVDTLKILDFIPNAVAKCMGVKEADWVDLDYIDPKNSFMVEHLQKSFIQIARRVVSRVKCYSTTYDQKSSIHFVDSNNVEVFNYGDERNDDEEYGDEVPFSGSSYTTSVKLMRKLVSREDRSLISPEVESSSDYIRRHLTDTDEKDIEDKELSLNDNTENCFKSEEASESESSTDFIRRHLALAEAEADSKDNSKQLDSIKPSDEVESSSDFIRRHLTEAGLQDESDYKLHSDDKKGTDDKCHTVGDKQFAAEREAADLYREYQAKVLEERDMNDMVELDDLNIVDTVAQISAPIPLGAFYLNKRINSKVWMSVSWNHEDGIDQSYKIHQKLNLENSNRNLFDNNSTSLPDRSVSFSNLDTHSHMSADCYSDMGFLARKPLIEYITLKIFPMYYDEMTVQPKMIRFSTWSLAALLDVHAVHHQMLSCNEIHKFSSEVRLSSIDVSAYVLFSLSKGAIGAHELCRLLTSFLRYEHTTQGIRVYVNGVDNDFCLGPSPEEMKLQLLENEHASIVLQSLVRRSIAQRKFRNLVLKEKLERHAKMNAAATQIQRIGRGYIERAMVKALLRQMKDNEEKARLLAEAEARDKILFCEMNNTDVEVTADSGDSPVEGDKVLELTEMNVHVTDAESRKVSSIKLEHINVERVWALYLAKFKKSFKFKSPVEVFNNLKARKKLLLFMTVHCLELFLSRQNGFMKMSLKDLCQYVVSVTVKIVSAKDLVNADAILGGRADALLGGKSDPYVVVRLGKEKFKTKTVKNNLNPEYDEDFTLVWNHELDDDKLCFDVMDKDLLSKDDLLGKCVVALGSVGIPTVKPIVMELTLEDCKHGTLQIEVDNVLESLT